MIYETGLETGLETGSAAGLSGNYATDLVRGMRGANLSEVEAVFCCYSFVIIFIIFWPADAKSFRQIF